MLFWSAAVLTYSTDCTCLSCIFVWQISPALFLFAECVVDKAKHLHLRLMQPDMATQGICNSCIFVWHKRHDVVQQVVFKKCCSNMFHYLTYNMLVQICWFRYVGSDMLVVMVSCATFWDSIFFLHCNKVIEQALWLLSCFQTPCISHILTWVCLDCFFGVQLY